MRTVKALFLSAFLLIAAAVTPAAADDSTPTESPKPAPACPECPS